MITSDSNTFDADEINEWVAAHGNEEGLDADTAIYIQDELMHRLFAGRKDELLYIAMGAAWPDDVHCSEADVIEQFEGYVRAMRGALLSHTADIVDRRWLTMTSDVSSLLSHVKAHYLPAHTRRIERTHPAKQSAHAVMW